MAKIWRHMNKRHNKKYNNISPSNIDHETSHHISMGKDDRDRIKEHLLP